MSIFSSIYAKVNSGGLTQSAQSGMMALRPLSVEPSFFYWYAITVLVVCSAFGSFIVGLIRTGKLSSGITLVPALVAGSIIIFLALNEGFGSFFGGMLVT